MKHLPLERYKLQDSQQPPVDEITGSHGYHTVDRVLPGARAVIRLDVEVLFFRANPLIALGLYLPCFVGKPLECLRRR